jgi:hypothetical protein
MFEPHEGTLQLKHKFQKAYNWLEKRGPSELKTKNGTRFITNFSTNLSLALYLSKDSQ